jgi:hypothetical protein
MCGNQHINLDFLFKPSFQFVVMLSLAQLLISLPVQVHERVDEVRNARTDVHEVEDDIFEIEIQRVRHVKYANFATPILKSLLVKVIHAYLMIGIV